MQYAEMKEKIESSFQPYHCGVAFLPADETQKTLLGIRVSNEDDSLVFKAASPLRAVRSNVDQHIVWWRDAAAYRGFKLDDEIS